MRKILILMCLLFIFSCSSIDSRVLTNVEILNISNEIKKVQDDIVIMANNNDKQNIKKRVVNSLINNIKFSYLDKYDLSKALIVFSDEIEIQSIIQAKSIVLINFELETMYFEVIWELIGNEWKIKSLNPQE